jgi:hypothetical protein
LGDEVNADQQLRWAAVSYVTMQLANLVKYHHARHMAMKRLCQVAVARLAGKTLDQGRLSGSDPSKLADNAAVEFAVLRAAFERVVTEEGADPNALLRGVPQGAMVVAMGDEVTARAGELNEPSVDAQAAFVRSYLAELHGIAEREDTAANRI